MLEALEEFNAEPTGRPRSHGMVDYALMNQCLYEGKAKEVEQMTRDALAEGRAVQEILNEGSDRRHERGGRGLQAQRAVRAGSADRGARHESRDGGAEASAQRQGQQLRNAPECC